MLTVDGSVNSRDARGGTAPIQVAKQLGVVRDTADRLRLGCVGNAAEPRPLSHSGPNTYHRPTDDPGASDPRIHERRGVPRSAKNTISTTSTTDAMHRARTRYHSRISRR